VPSKNGAASAGCPDAAGRGLFSRLPAEEDQRTVMRHAPPCIKKKKYRKIDDN
jgi:hypothetical protein